MPGCDTERALKGITGPFEICFQPRIEDIEKQKRDLEGSYSTMVLHENIVALCAKQTGKQYPCF